MSIKLEGNWKKGFAYDVHTLSSSYLGVDDFGYERWENVRTEMGECVYQLKYSNDVLQVDKIVNLLQRKFKGLSTFDFIVPIPPSQQRIIQPVYAIAKKLAEKNPVTYLQALGKKPSEQLKNIADVQERIKQVKGSMFLEANPCSLKDKKVLLVDDLYRSGTTLTAATDILIAASCKYVSVLTMTKTRSNR